MKTLSIAVSGLCAAALFTLTGCVTYVNPPPPAADVHVVPPPPPPEPPVVVIHHEHDFYEPLSPHGSWVVVGSYGRCWRPARVSADWRPYAHGYWQRTDAGWYWVSDEPWGWATYHYGRWDWTPRYGWVWIPQTQWAPAWVTWRQGAGYVGWAPLPPTARITVSGHVEIHEPAHPPRAFVFVEERRLLEPVRPQTVIVNNSTVINKTVNITKIKVVNKTVVNEGPRPEAIERVSGRKVQSLPTHDVRRKEEKGVVSRQRNVPSNAARKTVSPQVTAPPSRVTPPADRPAPVTTAPAQNPTRDVRKPAEQRSAESQSESTQTNVVATPQRSAPPATKPVETAKQPQPRPGRQAQKAAETKSAVAVMQPQTQTPVRKEHDRVMTRDNESSKLQRAAVTRTPHLPPKQAEMQADTKKGKAAAAKAAENAKKKKRSAPEGTSVQETPPQAPPPATSQP